MLFRRAAYTAAAKNITPKKDYARFTALRKGDGG